MTERVFFNKLVTKNLTATDSTRRYFEGYLTVQMVDKQNEITIVDELMKSLPIWISRGAPISDTHSNRVVGKGIAFQKTTITEGGKSYPAIFIQGEIYKDYELDDAIWKNIVTGKYKGLSFGGATRSDRIPIISKDGTTSYALKDLEHYEVAVCEDPAVPLALITSFNPIAKSIVENNNGKYIQKSETEHCIRCYSFGCYVDKSWQDTKDVNIDPSQVEGEKEEVKKDEIQKEELSDTIGLNKPVNDKNVVTAGKEITSGNQNDPTGEDPTFRGHAAKGDSPDVEEEIEESADIEVEEKTINAGENMNMEKPIRGLRGTGGLGSGYGESTRLGGKAESEPTQIKEVTKPIRGHDWNYWDKKLESEYPDKETRGAVIGAMENKTVGDTEYDNTRIVNEDSPPQFKENDEKVKNVGVTLEATGEEGGKPRVNDDNPAEGLKEEEDTHKATIYSQGGVRGRGPDATDQDSQQWDAQVTGPRETKHVDRGDKDGLSLIKSLSDKIEASEIRRILSKI